MESVEPEQQDEKAVQVRSYEGKDALDRPLRSQGPRHQNHDNRKRQRFNENHEPPVERWRDFIIRLGDKIPEPAPPVPVEEQVEMCALHVKKVLEEKPDELLELLMSSVEELPHKAPFYGTLVGLLHSEGNAFAAKVVDQLYSRLQDALDSGKCNHLRILLRFLTITMNNNVISSTVLVDAFNVLLASAISTLNEELGNPAWQPRADFYVFCVLAALPFGGEELAQRSPEDLQQILAGVEAYMNLRKRVIEPALWVFKTLPGGLDPAEEEDYLGDLWTRLRMLQENGWRAAGVPKPHLAFEPALSSAEPLDPSQALMAPPIPDPPPSGSKAASARQHQAASTAYPRRSARLRIFPPAKTDETMEPIDRFLIEEYLQDVLFYLNGCRRECAAYMAGLPVPFRYEFLMAEVVFSQMLLLPTPPFKIIYYTVVMVDLCKALPGAFPPVVAGAVRVLFSRVNDMDVECRTRLVQWLAHHLSNFQFVWPWDEWEHVLNLPPWDPLRVFAAEVLEKEVRLAYPQKIKETLQSSPRLLALLPASVGPVFKYAEKPPEGPEGEALTVEVELSTELTGLVREKKSARDILVWLDEKVTPVHGPRVALEVTALTLLNIGSKSFTHIVTVLERYGNVLHKLAGDQTMQHFLVGLVAMLWQNSAQMAAIVIDRMMGYRIVSNLAIVDWAFSPPCINSFHTTDRVLEVLGNAINKTRNRTVDLRKQLQLQKVACQAAKERAEQLKARVATVQATIVPPSEDMEEDEDLSVSQARKAAAAKLDYTISLATKAEVEGGNAEEELEVKEALLARAVKEQEALFVAVFTKFAEVLTSRAEAVRLRAEATAAAVAEAEAATDGGETAVEEESVVAPEDDGVKAMDADGEEDEEAPAEEKGEEENGTAKPRPMEEEAKEDLAAKEAYEAAEEKQWEECILGHIRALARHYASEIWPLIEELEKQISSKTGDPRVMDATYSGLCWHG